MLSHLSHLAQNFTFDSAQTKLSVTINRYYSHASASKNVQKGLSHVMNSKISSFASSGLASLKGCIALECLHSRTSAATDA